MIKETQTEQPVLLSAGHACDSLGKRRVSQSGFSRGHVLPGEESARAHPPSSVSPARESTSRAQAVTQPHDEHQTHNINFTATGAETARASLGVQKVLSHTPQIPLGQRWGVLHHSSVRQRTAIYLNRDSRFLPDYNQPEDLPEGWIAPRGWGPATVAISMDLRKKQVKPES